MKRILQIFALFHVMLYGIDVNSQAPAPQPIIYGSSPFQDSLWSLDTTNWTIQTRIGPTLVGFTITGMNGLAMDPTNYDNYIIMKLSAVTGRVLGKIDLQTGICTQVGNLGDNFSSIMFTSDGQLWGATGDGATVPESLYKIDKTNGTKTLMYTMGNGADGEIISYNPSDDFIYHWSGNGTVVFEKFSPSNLTYTPTNIPIIGTTGGETFGALYLTPTSILVSTISSNFRRFSTSGNCSGAIGSNPDDLRGLIMRPNFTSSSTTFCEGTETFFTASVGTQLFDSIIYNWGDGFADTVLTGGSSHVFATAGTYTVSIRMSPIRGAGFSTNDYTTFTVTVNPSPVVTFTGNTNLCPAATNILMASPSSGTHQWYMDGVLMSGQTTDMLSVSAPGIYNLINTNSFGCSDSAAVGLSVISVPNPTVNLGNDTSVCASILLDAQNAGATYLWNTASTTQTELVTVSGPYDVTVTDANGCSTNDLINVTVNALPVVNLGNDTTVCGNITLDAQNAGASYLWNSGTTTQTELVTLSGPAFVNVTDANGCSSSDTVLVTINALPVVSLGNDTAGCTSVIISPNMSGTYLWSDNSTGSSLNVSATGTYSVTVTDGNGCSNSDAVLVTINNNPVVVLSATGTTACIDDANLTLTGTPAGGTYSGPGVTGSSFDPSIGAGVQVATYNYTDGNGCSNSATFAITVSACVGINEVSGTTLSIYPNPSTGILTIEVPASGSTLEVTDVLGNIVYTQNNIASGKTMLDLSAYAEGTYFVKLTVEQTISVSKVILQR